jgi:hypothetical protein
VWQEIGAKGTSSPNVSLREDQRHKKRNNTSPYFYVAHPLGALHPGIELDNRIMRIADKRR